MMNKNTRIYNRFEFWTVADCRCRYCVNYRGKNRPCSLEVCCIADIRKEALKREQEAVNGSHARKEARLCRA